MLGEQQAERAVAERPNSRLVTVDSGHWIHDDAPAALAGAVGSFLVQRP
jgi:pimeloyl-ACP methyl ester carboxylesterase